MGSLYRTREALYVSIKAHLKGYVTPKPAGKKIKIQFFFNPPKPVKELKKKKGKKKS
jgi:hypothetical protein